MSTLIIRHLTGQQKGKEQTVTAQEASFGTGPGNTVRLDAVWDRGVSSSHARVFRDDAGQWQLEDAGSSTGTFVNGQRVTTRRPVTGSIVVELGSGGPKMEIVLPPPLGASAARADAGRPKPKAGGGKGSLIMAVTALVVAVVGYGLIVGLPAGGDSDRRLQTAAKNYEGGIGLVVIAGNDESTPVGTAWAFAPNMFATNAHVATPVLQAMKKGASAFVAINRRPDQRLRIKAAIPHPRFFDREVGINGNAPATTPYDVGILIVEGNVQTPLKLAPTAKLQALDSGHRVAFLGFPMEDLRNGGVDPKNPVATMQSGIITAVTDFWLAKSVFENRRLIQHNLPTVGGSSGSPIFDPDGEVIGILSSGNMIAAMTIESWADYQNQIEGAKKQALEKAKQAAKGQPDQKVEELAAELNATLEALDRIPLPVTDLKRAPSAAMVNYAQRIDMLEELLALLKAAQSDSQ